MSRIDTPCSSRMVLSSVLSSSDFARVEAGGGLVEAQQHRIDAHCAGDLQPALRAVRELAGGIVGALQETDLVEPIFGAFNRPGLGGAVVRRAEQAEHRHAARPHQQIMVGDHDVFQDRHALEEPDVLEGARDLRVVGDQVSRHTFEQEHLILAGLGAARRGAGQRFDGVAVDAARARQRQPAFGRLVEAGHAVEHCSLAGAVGTNQRSDVAATDLERQIVDGDEAAEAHRQMLDDEQRIALPTHQPCPSLTSSPETAVRLVR